MKLELILVTGMSGSGKSIALNALEDAGYFCVDNLPPELLLPFVSLERNHHAHRLAIGMDVRSSASLLQVPDLLLKLQQKAIVVKLIFLDSTTDTLVRRYSETRRKHPLSQSGVDLSSSGFSRALIDAIELERELLGALREHAHVIDSTYLRRSQLQQQIKALAAVPGDQLTLVFQSFAFKRGVPSDADFVFDVRMLPNPHYEPELQDLTGRDEAVVAFLLAQPPVQQMLEQITAFLADWLPALAQDQRSYVTVAVGCTGGQHRSVYLVERLAQHFGGQWNTLKQHREIDAL